MPVRQDALQEILHPYYEPPAPPTKAPGAAPQTSLFGLEGWSCLLFQSLKGSWQHSWTPSQAKCSHALLALPGESPGYILKLLKTIFTPSGLDLGPSLEEQPAISKVNLASVLSPSDDVLALFREEKV